MKKIFPLAKLEDAYSKTSIKDVYCINLKSPIYAQYEVTSSCNYDCVFCYNEYEKSKRREMLPKNEQLEIIRKLGENEIFELTFSGGEPLLDPYLPKLVKKAREFAIKCVLITNGSLLDLKRAKELKNAGISEIQISFHHPTPQSNDRITQKEGSFKKTVKGIKNALEVFGDILNVNMVGIKSNYKDVYKMARFLNKIGVKEFTVGALSYTGKMKKNREIGVTKSMFIDMYQQLQRAKKDFGINVGFTGGFPLCVFPKVTPAELNMIINVCDAGIVQVVIDPDGNVRPCVSFKKKLGNILKTDLKEIWDNSSFLNKLRRMKQIPEDCKNCKYVSLCKGGCRASAYACHGKLNAPYPWGSD